MISGRKAQIQGGAHAANSDDDNALLPEEMPETAGLDEPMIEDYALDDEEEVGQSTPRWLWPALAGVLVLGWFVAMLWLAAPVLGAPLGPIALVEFIGALCVPPALIGIIYLLGMRTSTAEARRFGATARAMRAEAASLERVVATLARKIEQNRQELRDQTTQLMAMGDSAGERLQAIANGMAQATRSIDGSARALGEATGRAERSLSVVLASLPKAHSEISAVAGRLDAAGLAASERTAALDAQLAALAMRGRDADEVASGAAMRLAAHITRMEATSETAGARLEAVTGEMSTAVDGVLDRAAQAVDQARKGIATQGEAMLAMLEANQAALDRASRDSADALARRIATIEEAIGRITASLGEEQNRSDALIAQISNGIAKLDEEIGAVHASGIERSQALAASIDTLSGSVGAVREAMNKGETLARGVIGTAEELLTALDASAREIDETLPEALQRLDTRIAASRKVVAEARPELLALVTAAERTHTAVQAIAGVVAAQRDMLANTSEALAETLDQGRAKTDAMESIVDETIATSRRFAEEAAPQLVDTLIRVRETASVAADHARQAIAGIVPDAAKALEEAGSAALRRAVDETVRRQVGELAATTEAAVDAAARASERLAQQMLTIAQTTAAVENRIDTARAQREEADSEQFARRVSLLIEALNSASIDITKTFAPEVTDTAWAAYLKGDRGVFTRRAVRLLDGGEAREIVRLYDDDEGFRDNVNRYIHDFEGMLRQILALRDGSPMGVTLLSSDMGKLYVALAQAIERLRT